MAKIGWVGVGAMGGRMAERLLQAGHELRVYNRKPARLQPLLQAGARAASSPREAATGADWVCAMVTDDAASRSVWLDGEHGLLSGLKHGALATEFSTLTPGWVRELSGRVKEVGAHWLDAPVVGSRGQAEAGTLVHLVGGESHALDRAMPWLEPLSGAVHHVGPAGAGASFKLAVNALFAAQLAALGEALGTLAADDIAPERSADILAQLAITSPAAKGAAQAMVAGVHAPMFPVDLVEKDLRYAIEQARHAGVESTMLGAAHAAFGRAQKQGLGAQNITAVARMSLERTPSNG